MSGEACAPLPLVPGAPGVCAVSVAPYRMAQNSSLGPPGAARGEAPLLEEEAESQKPTLQLQQ